MALVPRLVFQQKAIPGGRLLTNSGRFSIQSGFRAPRRFTSSSSILQAIPEKPTISSVLKGSDFGPSPRKKKPNRISRDDVQFVLMIAALAVTLFLALEGLPQYDNLIAQAVSKLIGAESLQRSVSEDLQKFIADQGPALRATILKETLDHPDVREFANQWAVERAKECCADPQVVDAMGNLIMAAVELPATKEAVSQALGEVLQLRETKESAMEFLEDTLTQPCVHTHMAQISKEALTTIVNDAEVQSTMWQFMKRSLLPRWRQSSDGVKT
eukprot:Protomagalhaensia_wolfi_Nauph_80__6352@NODE_999_length_1821_cov_36_976431_g756_i0_p1_GENE_NODE_999_length_1821_cov_36_976431_g756_i0NODE_999_length_1821_cov_36_976431_g756_i0_p1_ORF_typecomplete_len272_score50_37GerD/PF17898_1/1_5e03GerD/PF17898_1/1_7e03GerD/PF17898_1/0_0015TraGD_C/PF12696_7/3_6e03TraGD_C/PF12696_7/0_091DnaI_N/PF07319_11/19DnaI_N/PF07319_11/71DnaI_N/PF07319_11/1_4e02_NODE_999_length_1821_cov_36_976431_g756_i09751790